MSHVVIVGAGSAGASLAYLLANRGVEVTLLRAISVRVHWFLEGRVSGVAHHVRRRSPASARVG